ncbi:Hypothetical predicted protein [Cloeon dipterum]|uniref:C-type lectin domain-containing protein n=2 Tax=Cloeon dipterum TaxID=197152 RepID=A0A8S1DYH3_9INSE|nr:Hypothetical predicted protein [Cloeon dipterum]
MNICCVISFISLVLIAVGQSQAKLFEISNKSPSSKLTRRIIIVKCCGFKRCLPSRANLKNRTIPTTSKRSKPSQFTESGFASFSSNEAIPTGNYGGLKQTAAGESTMETLENDALKEIEDFITDGGVVTSTKTTTTTFRGNDKKGTRNSVSVASSKSIFSTKYEETSGATAVAPEILRSSPTETAPKSEMMALSTLPTFFPTEAATIFSTTVASSSTMTRATTSLKTTTTPAPCFLNCSDFNDFLLRMPTQKPSQSDGSIQYSTSCKRQYYVSKTAVSRNEAALRCKALDMNLLTVTSLEELNCLSSFPDTFWTSGSMEGKNCGLEKRFSWCSTGYDISPTLISMEKFWLRTDATPSTLERCLAVVTSINPLNQGMIYRNCDDALPYICQFNVDCPKQCQKNPSLFDPAGNLIDQSSYGVWIDIESYTYLLGNKPMSWLSSWQQCCALGMETLNIDNAAEQLGLTNLTFGATLNTWKMNFNYWTSATRKGSPVGQWSWCEPYGPTIFPPNLTWQGGQPDNNGGNESCVHYRFVLNSTGTILTDRNCANKLIFACKTRRVEIPKPCIASCPGKSCRRDATIFDVDNKLIDYTTYGEWFDGCGRTNLFYTKNKLNWTSGREQCCALGLTMTSMESAGKLSCLSKTVIKFAPLTYGDFWLSGTNLGCPSGFRWCSLDRDFINPELRWKTGHPVEGLNCVYLESRNGSVLLATADCAEEKNLLCDLRRKAASSQIAMQNECAEIWNIPSDQIDFLLNTTAFGSATISQNLKCFLKCIGFDMGVFKLGKLIDIDTLRQIELVTQEEPVKLEQGFAAYDECSGIKLDDECVTAHEIYKCGFEKAPTIVTNIVKNNYDATNMGSSPIPFYPVRRTCWLSKFVSLRCKPNCYRFDQPVGKRRHWFNGDSC